MIKIRRAAAVTLTAALLLSGCSFSNRGSATELQADEEGRLIQIIAEKQDDAVDVDELKTYIEEQTAAFNDARGGEEAASAKRTSDKSSSAKSGSDKDPAIELDSCRVKDGKLQIRLAYDGYQSYMAFNGVQCFLGTISEAKSAGYSFDREFLNEKGKTDEDAGQTIGERANEWKVLITEEPMRLRVPDKILYTSTNMKTSGRMTAVSVEDASGTEGSGQRASDAEAAGSSSEEGEKKEADDAGGAADAGSSGLEKFVIDDFELFYVIFK